MASYKPAGFHSITPYVVLQDAPAGIEYYKSVFGAVEQMRDLTEDGRIRHAQIKIGDSYLMLVSENEAWKMYGPKHYGGSPVHLFLYVEDADAVFGRATAAGATVVMGMSDQSYGRTGGVVDPFGMTWWITTHKE